MDFPGVRALANVDLVVDSGEVHAIVGENGAGKSTLIKILSGVYKPTSGKILLNGRDVQMTGPREALTRGIGVVYQDRTLVPFLTAAENMLLGREPTFFGTLDCRAIRVKAEEVLRTMGLSVPLDVPVSHMCAGDQQLVEIAKVVMTKPRIMVLDEPTAALSRREVESLLTLLQRLREQGIAVIYISHHLDEIFRIADTVTILRNGQVAATGPVGAFTPEQVIRFMIGRDPEQQYIKEPIEIGREVLRVEALTSAEAGITDVSLYARAGEVVGLGGLMGAGRSELASVLFGVTRADSGRIMVDGREVNPRSVAEAIRAGIYLIPEKRREYGLIPGESVMSNITLPFLRDFSVFGVVGTRRESAHVRSLIDRLRIKARGPYDNVSMLSGGNQQKVVVGKWLARPGRVFILDEPTQGIDVGAKTEVYQMMLNIAKGGAAVLFISSDLRELVAMSDRVYVMREGRVAAEIAREELTADAVLRHALGGVQE